MTQQQEILLGLLLPLAGTAAGSACVFFLKKAIGDSVRKALLGFASGVMVAASIFSLLLPAMESVAGMGRYAFVPAAIGTGLGMGFLLLLDSVIPHLHMDSDRPEGMRGRGQRLSKAAMLCLAVTLHNIPEGMAPGVVLAGAINGDHRVSMAAALSLALGIAIQNFPEGAVVSMSLAAEGKNKGRAFLLGTASGVVEPLAALLTIVLTGLVSPLLPYLLSFAAGAMLYVVVEELIPEASEGTHSNHGTVGFGAGFILMMVLDVALG